MNGEFNSTGNYYKYLGGADGKQNLIIGNSYKSTNENSVSCFIVDDLGKITEIKWRHLKYDGVR